jgi:hypothetical protein
MLDKDPMNHADEVRNDPVFCLSESRKAAVYDYEVAVRHNLLMLVLEHWRHALDQIEQAVATGPDVGTVLHVVR